MHIIVLYTLVGSVVSLATVGLARGMRDTRMPPPERPWPIALLIFLLWPVMVVGLLQWVLFAILGRTLRRGQIVER